MTKHDYGHMDCPFYEEKLDNGMTLVFLPKKSKLTSAALYVGQGGFLHSKEISSSRIPFGSAYYLMNLVCSDSFKEDLRREGCLFGSDLDYSYVRYFLNTMDDIFPCLDKLMKRVLKPAFDECDVVAFKEKERILAEKRIQDPILVSQNGCLNNLYFSSPIRYGYIPSYEDSVRIHASSLRKYQETYYVPENLVLFLSMDDSIENVLPKIKKMVTGRFSIKPEEKKFEYEEDYTKVNQEYKEIRMDVRHSYLTYGIKFPSRSIIYDNYGELTFCAYEILITAITSNREFQTQLGNLRAELVDATLKQGGEDGYILLTFQTENEVVLVNFLTAFFSKLGEKMNASQFDALTKDTFARCVREVSTPNKAVDDFSRSYANHIPYTAMMRHIYKMSFSSYRRFMEEFKSFKKAVCFVKRNETYAG
jgi:hypothetical protein